MKVVLAGAATITPCLAQSASTEYVKVWYDRIFGAASEWLIPLRPLEYLKNSQRKSGDRILIADDDLPKGSPVFEKRFQLPDIQGFKDNLERFIKLADKYRVDPLHDWRAGLVDLALLLVCPPAAIARINIGVLAENLLISGLDAFRGIGEATDVLSRVNEKGFIVNSFERHPTDDDVIIERLKYQPKDNPHVYCPQFWQAHYRAQRATNS